jgi:hypothetical protein
MAIAAELHGATHVGRLLLSIVESCIVPTNPCSHCLEGQSLQLVYLFTGVEFAVVFYEVALLLCPSK